MKVKTLKVERKIDGFYDFENTPFMIEYEEMKWYYFGKAKTVKRQVNIKNYKADAWFTAITKTIGVWRKY